LLKAFDVDAAAAAEATDDDDDDDDDDDALIGCCTALALCITCRCDDVGDIAPNTGVPMGLLLLLPNTEPPPPKLAMTTDECLAEFRCVCDNNSYSI
jgi:hypothetical protein